MLDSEEQSALGIRVDGGKMAPDSKFMVSLDDLSIPSRDLLEQLNKMLPQGKERHYSRLHKDRCDELHGMDIYEAPYSFKRAD